MAVRKMHSDEVDTDESLVRRLLAAQFPHWANLPITRVFSAGTDNAMYRLGEAIVVRMPRIHWAVEGLDKEYEWLPWLAPRLPVAIPTPLGRGKPDLGYPWHWSIYRWLEGENPNEAQLANPAQLAMELAAFIAAMQRIDPSAGPPSGRSLAQRDAYVRSSIAALQSRIDTGPITAAWDAALKIPEWQGPPVWLHGDLAPGNVLLVGGQLSAVIDFSGVGVGDPATDLRVAWNLLPSAVRNDFRNALKVDDATWARARGLALGQALVQLPYYWETNPTLAANARHVIAAVLAEHEELF